MSLAEIYSSMWDDAQHDILQGRMQIDPWIGNESDPRYGMTLIARPTAQVADAVVHAVADIAQLEPGQYVYPMSDLHVTVLSLISCHTEFRVESIQVEAYAALIEPILKETAPIRIHFKGLTLSPTGLVVKGDAAGNELNALRDQLRSAFKASGLTHTIDQRYTLQTAHITVFRFKQSLRDAARFIRHVATMREVEFGSTTLQEMELVGNNWTMQQKRIRQLGTFSLL